MRTLIIADNQDITKAGILYLSDRMPDLSLVTEAADKHELLQLIPTASAGCRDPQTTRFSI